MAAKHTHVQRRAPENYERTAMLQSNQGRTGDPSVGHAQKGLLCRLNAQTRSSGFTAVPTASVKEPRASEQLYGSFS